VEYFFFPIAFGFWILLADELRKFWARKYPEGWVAWLAW
jgi:sodium/potassium-transporting ATPase subunit alpha